MITNLLVIQRIDLDAKAVKVSQVLGNYFQWTFQTEEERTDASPVYFPFEINGKYEVEERKPGAETKLNINEDYISFKDDYGVPDGSVVAILLPAGYVPDMLKFKNAAYIPVNFDIPVYNRLPGHVQLCYNFKEKRSAIVIHLNERTVFGFKCIAKKVSDDQFPDIRYKDTDDLFDVNISRELLAVDHISEEDLKIVNRAISENLKPEEIAELLKDLNELLASIKDGNNTKATGIYDRLSNSLTTSVGTISGLVTIADSFTAGNSAALFVKKILSFLLL
jgi:hypothetical protein